MQKPQPAPWTLAPLVALLVSGLLALPGTAQEDSPPISLDGHHEVPDDPFIAVDRATQPRSPRRIVTVGPFTSVQVNVDMAGLNIVGDAANEPSIAVDPNNPLLMIAGWRQFDTVASNFRQAGVGYSHDGGTNWVFPGTIDTGVFRSDPVVGVDNSGIFYYYSLRVPGGNSYINDMFFSATMGTTWGPPHFACGGDKAWFTIDDSPGLGDPHVYGFWTSTFSCPGASGNFNRSTTGGATWDPEIPVPIQWGTLDVSSDGTLSLIGTPGGSGFSVLRSSNAQNPGEAVVFDATTTVDLGGNLQGFAGGPNPGGLLGQAWIASNPQNDHLYALASVNPPGADPLDVHFSRSMDGGATWSAPLRVNDVAAGYQWFGTMSVAPNGRIDVIWNDTRNAGGGLVSELFYSFSTDGGETWSPNLAMTPGWDPLIGHPQQNKIGDYYDMVSYNDAAHLIYAATFNGEQDVYYLRIASPEIFADGFESGDTSGWSTAVP